MVEDSEKKTRFDLYMKSFFKRMDDSKQLACSHPTLFLLHLWIFSFIGFSITIFSLSFNWLLRFDPTQLFYLYLTFHSSIFIGAIIHSNVTRRINVKWNIVANLILLSSSMCALPHINNIILFSIVSVLLGGSIGITLSALTSSFTTIFRQTSYMLVQLLHLVGALGSVTAVMLFETVPQRISERQSLKIQNGPRIPSIENFRMLPRLCPEYVYYIAAIVQIPAIAMSFRTEFKGVIKSAISIRRSEYDDIDNTINQLSLTQQSDMHSFKLVLLCSVVACIANIMYAVFPFLILAQPGCSYFYYQLFSIFFVMGRAVSIVISDLMAPYFLVGVAIFGCGVACCCLASSEYIIIILGSILFGFFLSPILPALVTYLNHALSLKSTNTLILLSGHCAGHIMFPLLLAVATPRLFIALNLIAILLLVVVLVSILSLHAQIERTQASQSGLNLFVSRFLSGESLLMRTRSIRPLISRLRPNSYRRFANRRGNSPRSPSPCVSSQTEVSVQADELTKLTDNSNDNKSTLLLIPTRV